MVEAFNDVFLLETYAFGLVYHRHLFQIIKCLIWYALLTSEANCHVLFQFSIFMPEMRFQLVSLDLCAIKLRLYMISKSSFGSCFKNWMCCQGLSFNSYRLQLIVRHIYNLLPDHYTPQIPFAFSLSGWIWSHWPHKFMIFTRQTYGWM